MSDLILRGLLLSDSVAVQNKGSSEAVKLRKLSLPENESSVATAQTLSRLDALLLSDTSQVAKGSVPINLLSPMEISGDNKKVVESVNKPVTTTATKPKTSGTSRLAALTGLTTSGKPIPSSSGKGVLQPLSELKQVSSYTSTSTYNATSSTNYTQTTGNKKVIGSVSSTFSGTVASASISFVESTDKTSEKLSTAIEKIQNWDRKIRTLDALLENANVQNYTPTTSFKTALVNGADQLTLARKDAIDARKEAIFSYNDAVKEINAQIKSSSYSSLSSITASSMESYRGAYNTMETLFTQTKAKDLNTMDKAKSYLKTAFNFVLEYSNPF